jgi:aspartate/methionine/tyrosine aminotransferase
MIDAPIDRINQERMRLESEGEPIVNLGQAIPDFTPPLVATEAAIQALRDDPRTHVYTPDPGLPELREAVARSLRLRFAASIQAEEIVITAGANHAFLLVCSILIEPGDRVGLLSPFFLNHKMAVEGCGGAAIEICPDDDFSYSPETIERTIVDHQLRALVVVNPSNPTGKVFAREELQALIDLCRKYEIWLISDEVYGSFVYAPGVMTSLVGLPGAADCTFTIGSFSKEFGMTGWRLGWVRSPREIFSQIVKVQDYSIICASRLAQVLALAAMEGAPDWAQRHLGDFEKRRQALVSELESSGLFRLFASQGAYFVWLRPHAEVDSEREVIAIMRRGRVCVIPGAFFGTAWRGWFRISYGAQEITALQTAARRFIDYFSSRQDYQAEGVTARPKPWESDLLINGKIP